MPCVLVQRVQRHHEARRAEAALRAMALDQRLLHRVQRAVLAAHVLDGEQGLAVQRGQELDARVDGLQPDAAIGLQFAEHHRACTAIALRAPFFGACAVGVFTQVLQHRPGDRGVRHGADLPAMEKADGLSLHGGLVPVSCL